MAWKDFWDRMTGRAPRLAKIHLPPVDKSKLVRKRIYFSGEVQGVGFRYRCIIHAKELGVTGFAQNLLDGRVRAEFQSDQRHIDALIEALKQEPWIEISGMEVSERPLEPGEREFVVDYF